MIAILRRGCHRVQHAKTLQSSVSTVSETGTEQEKALAGLEKGQSSTTESLARIEQLESNTLQPLYATLADLPSATDHHGKVAHVHAEGALYFAHAGNWVKLQNA